jgi:hypothetical protein
MGCVGCRHSGGPRMPLHADAQSRRDAEPTVVETLEWISGVTKDVRGYWGGVAQPRRIFRSWTDSYTGCTMNYVVLDSSPTDPQDVVTWRTPIHLGQLTPRTETRKSSLTDEWQVHLSTSSGSHSIVSTATRGDRVWEASNYYVVINTRDQATGDRVAAALSHAIRLCGGKESPF